MVNTWDACQVFLKQIIKKVSLYKTTSCFENKGAGVKGIQFEKGLVWPETRTWGTKQKNYWYSYSAWFHEMHLYVCSVHDVGLNGKNFANVSICWWFPSNRQ